MEDGRKPKKLMCANMFGVRKRVRPRKWWILNVEKDLKAVGVINWKEKAKC